MGIARTGECRQLEDQASTILRSAGYDDLAVYTDIAPPTDALAHAIRAGIALHEFRTDRLEDDYSEESTP